MTESEKQQRALRLIISMGGPHPKACTNTPEHWKGVVNAIKDIARRAIKK